MSAEATEEMKGAPPSPDEIHWTMINHAAVPAVKAVAEAPLLAPGERAAKPIPEPSARSIKATAPATKAPAMIAAQETAETDDSRLPEASTVVVCALICPCLRQCQSSRMMRMTGIGMPRSQSRIARPMDLLRPDLTEG